MHKEIPQEIQKFIMSVEFSDTIIATGKSLGLDYDQTGELGSILRSVLLGDIPSKKFEDEIKQRLEVNSETAGNITMVVNDRIFKNLKDQIRALMVNESSDSIPVPKMDIKKEEIINSIENPSASRNTTAPINLLSEEYPLVIPGQKSEPTQKTVATNQFATSTVPTPSASIKPSPSLNFMDRMMSSPVSTKTETVEKKIGELQQNQAQPAQPMPPKPKTPAGPDPYREPIE